MRRFLPLLISLLVASSALLALAQGNIRGSIVAANGSPLPNVAVFVVAPSGQRVAAATTNAAGRFVLPPVRFSSSLRLEIYWGNSRVFQQSLGDLGCNSSSCDVETIQLE